MIQVLVEESAKSISLVIFIVVSMIYLLSGLLLYTLSPMKARIDVL